MKHARLSPHDLLLTALLLTFLSYTTACEPSAFAGESTDQAPTRPDASTSPEHTSLTERIANQSGSHLLLAPQTRLFASPDADDHVMITGEDTKVARFAGTNGDRITIKTTTNSGRRCFGRINHLDHLDLTLYADPESLQLASTEPLQTSLSDQITLSFAPGALVVPDDDTTRIHTAAQLVTTTQDVPTSRRYSPGRSDRHGPSQTRKHDKLPDALQETLSPSAMTTFGRVQHSDDGRLRMDLWCSTYELTGDAAESIDKPTAQMIGTMSQNVPDYFESGHHHIPPSHRRIKPDTPASLKNGPTIGRTTGPVGFDPSDATAIDDRTCSTFGPDSIFNDHSPSNGAPITLCFPNSHIQSPSSNN